MDHQTTNIFNSTIISSALSAAYELGFIDELKKKEAIEINIFCQEKDLHQPSFEAIVSALCCGNICQIDDSNGRVNQGMSFEEAYNYKGYFLWLIRGYGHLLQNLASSGFSCWHLGHFIIGSSPNFNMGR